MSGENVTNIMNMRLCVVYDVDNNNFRVFFTSQNCHGTRPGLGRQGAWEDVVIGCIPFPPKSATVVYVLVAASLL